MPKAVCAIHTMRIVILPEFVCLWYWFAAYRTLASRNALCALRGSRLRVSFRARAMLSTAVRVRVGMSPVGTNCNFRHSFRNFALIVQIFFEYCNCRPLFRVAVNRTADASDFKCNDNRGEKFSIRETAHVDISLCDRLDSCSGRLDGAIRTSLARLVLG